MHADALLELEERIARLGEEFRGAEAEALTSFGVREVAGGIDDDGHVAVSVMTAEPVDELEAVHPGQPGVEEGGGRRRSGGSARWRPPPSEAVQVLRPERAERVRDDGAGEVRVVLDDEHVAVVGASSERPA